MVCMKQRIWQILLLSVCLASIACKKSNNSGKSKTDLITQATWKFDQAGIDADGNGTIDSPIPPGILQNCDTDNTITFMSNGSGTADEGPTKCNPANPQTSSFTWSLKNNETIINFSNSLFGSLSGDVKLIAATETQLTLEKAVTFGILTADVVVILKH